MCISHSYHFYLMLYRSMTPRSESCPLDPKDDASDAMNGSGGGAMGGLDATNSDGNAPSGGAGNCDNTRWAY